MAANSNRSPSPLSSRPSSNPNPRNSENSSSIRRSFSGSNPSPKPSFLTNPRRFESVTPANSPSDFGRRRSVGNKEGRFCEEKENDEKYHNLKPSKLQSPAKGSKNFMSPTISAASKFTPSPRKKVLVERNDPVRTSISLSDGKAMFFSTMSDFESKSENSSDLNVADSDKSKPVLDNNPVSKPPKKVTFSDVPSDSHHTTESVVTNDSDSLKFETSIKNRPSVSPSIAPLDADPSLPPYDPKTNYLSPRPQFLHYRPNPRIGILLNKEKGLNGDEFEPLEDSFMADIMSENFSDSECTEESQTEEESPKEETEVTDSADMVIGLEEIEVDSHVPEPSESLPFTNSISGENLIQKSEKKPWVLSRFMCFSILAMFLIACVSILVTNSPWVDKFVIKDLSFSDLSVNFYHQSRAAADSAKVNFNRLALHVNEFSVNSLSFVASLYNELGEGEKLGPLQFMNLSDLQKNTWNEGNFMSNEIQEELGEEDDELDLEEEEEEDDELVDLDSEMDIYDEGPTYEEADFDVMIFEKELDTQEDSEYLEDIQSQGEAVSTTTNVEVSENSANQLAVISQKQETELDIASDRAEAAKISSDNQLAHIQQDQESEMETAVEVASSSSCAAAIASVHNESPSDVGSLSEVVAEASSPYENKFLARYAMETSSLFTTAVVLLTLALAAVIYKKYERIPSLVNVVPSEHKNKHQEKAYSQNWQTEVDEIGEESSSACPSEMSSFQQTTSYNNISKRERSKVGGGASEVQSLERKMARKYSSKRESLASSASEFSPSYGSFTTFERIPIKLASGDEEEIVTPVRRSSRIRNHYVTSP